MMHLKGKPPAPLAGKHFYCDFHEIIVTVVDDCLIQLGEEVYASAKGVKVKPWWSYYLGEIFWVKREELEPIEKFSCELSERPAKKRVTLREKFIAAGTELQKMGGIKS